MTLLLEYGEWSHVEHANDLKRLLREIWSQRLFVNPEQELSEDQQDSQYQPFLKFDGKQIRANNFVGFVQNGGEVIEIYPKVFKALGDDVEPQKDLMLRHIFYWFKYCRKWQFPFTRASLDTNKIDKFPELIINRIANQFLEAVSNQPLTLYQPIEEALQTPRGSINFKRYLSGNFARGTHHIIDCDHEPFLLDNRVNRIIKYCSRLLMTQTGLAENLQILQNVVFVLDEVEDVPCSIHDVESVRINSFFDDYLFLMDACRMILGQQLYSSRPYDLSQWCLLFPMEYIFEDFFAGFLESNFGDRWKVEYQKSNAYLVDNPKAFQMQHDIFLTDRSGRKIIVDTKYKMRPPDFKDETKKGVAQSDLYQLVSYALKRGCTELFLVYPNAGEQVQEKGDCFEIISGFGGETIRITAFEIPFWSINDFPGLDDALFDAVERNLN
jgi:5-methylcytosine-specific restriction enzyme subunit McrC